MKKLITEKDIEKAKSNSEKCIYINKKTLITPAAKDLARIYEIEFSTQEQVTKAKICNDKKEEKSFDTEEIYNLLKSIIDEELSKQIK